MSRSLRGATVLALPGATLTAPGVLANPVPVEALYDQERAFDATLQNLVQRKGFASFEAALDARYDEGVEKGVERGVETGIEKGSMPCLTG